LLKRKLLRRKLLRRELLRRKLLRRELLRRKLLRRELLRRELLRRELLRRELLRRELLRRKLLRRELLRRELLRRKLRRRELLRRKLRRRELLRRKLRRRELLGLQPKRNPPRMTWTRIQLLRSLDFSNNSANPPTGSRTASIVVALMSISNPRFRNTAWESWRISLGMSLKCLRPPLSNVTITEIKAVRPFLSCYN
jgi:hypothetical protein